MVARTLLLVYGSELFLKRRYLAVELFHGVDLAQKILQAFVDDLLSDFLFIESDQLLDGADAFLEVLAQGEEFIDHDGRARKSFQNAVLAALDSLRDFNLAFTSEQ